MGGAYELFRDQFPLAAARRDYYGLPCDSASVRARFLLLARTLGVSARDALEIFRPDVWVLVENSDKYSEKVGALRSVAESDQEMLDFLRAAPRTLGTTSVS